MATRRKQALGKGLGSLLGGTPTAIDYAQRDETPPAGEEASPTGEQLERLPLDAIQPNPHQPRREFDPAKLEELAQSIREHGVLQPLLAVRDGGRVVLLAGERRLRASELAGLAEVPVRVLQATEVQRLEVALIENVQREDLNPIEEARAYQELNTSFGYSQDQIAKQVGKSRVAIANALRLLRLTESAIHDLESGKLSAGHARALLMLSHPLQQEALREEIHQRQLTVRQAEARARDLLEGKTLSKSGASRKDSKGSGNAAPDKDQLDVVALEEKLTVRLGCRTRIRQRSAKSGVLEVHYASLDDLDRVLDLLEVQLDD